MFSFFSNINYWGSCLANSAVNYAADRAAGTHRAHMGTIQWKGQGSRFDIDQYDLLGHLAR